MFDKKELEKIKQEKDKWEKESYFKTIKKQPERKEKFENLSSNEIKNLYTPWFFCMCWSVYCRYLGDRFYHTLFLVDNWFIHCCDSVDNRFLLLFSASITKRYSISEGVSSYASQR